MLPPPKDVHVLIHKTCKEFPIRSKRCFGPVMKRFGMGRYPALYQWTPWHHQHPHKREAGGQSQSKRPSDGSSGPSDAGHQPRNTGSL